jgi:hypothetical protein
VVRETEDTGWEEEKEEKKSRYTESKECSRPHTDPTQWPRWASVSNVPIVVIVIIIIIIKTFSERVQSIYCEKCFPLHTIQINLMRPACQSSLGFYRWGNWGIKTGSKPVLVAHACNPSYSGSRDQEDCSSKPAQENSSQDPILKNNRAGGMTQVVEHCLASLRPWVQTPVSPSPRKKDRKQISSLQIESKLRSVWLQSWAFNLYGTDVFLFF